MPMVVKTITFDVNPIGYLKERDGCGRALFNGTDIEKVHRYITDVGLEGCAVGVGVLSWILSAGCTERTVYEYETIEEHQMEDAQYLRRLSLDIRGRVPTIEEWANFDATNPQVTIDAFLEDEGFGMRIRSMYAPIYRTVTDTYNLTGADFHGMMRFLSPFDWRGASSIVVLCSGE